MGNLRFIKEYGINRFLVAERRKWISDEGVFCIHDGKLYA